jgi:hypothetical protein
MFLYHLRTLLFALCIVFAGMLAIAAAFAASATRQGQPVLLVLAVLLGIAGMYGLNCPERRNHAFGFIVRPVARFLGRFNRRRDRLSRND